LCAFFFAATISIFAQGSLTPPGAPAPTMKALDQIASTGIAINATNTPGNASALFVISLPGSYYLTGNITGVSGKNGIVINAENVSLDLNGFALIGVSGASSGVLTNPNIRNVRVHDGTIRSWPVYGVLAFTSPNGVLERLRILDCGAAGVFMGDGSVVKDCLLRGNADAGIYARVGSLITGCTVENNAGLGMGVDADCHIVGCTVRSNGGAGIDPAPDCHIKDCVATGNGSFGIRAPYERVTVIHCNTAANTGGGISVGNEGIVRDCTANGNTGTAANGITALQRCVISGCTASGNSGSGISVDRSSTVSGCTANTNTTYGINAAGRNRVSDCVANDNSNSGIHITFTGTVERNFCNTNAICGIVSDNGGFVDILDNNCSENGGSNTGAGIRVSVAGGCRIEHNNIGLNYRGIDVLSGRNIIARNVAVANSNADYNIVPGNSYGPIVIVTGVNDISGTVNANHPAANFRY
jgi:parallel beta-helix repeat protein